MVSTTRKAIQEQHQDIAHVFAAVENIRGMSEHVNRASVEQKRAADQIAESMEDAIAKFSEISSQTDALKRNADHIVSAMHTIESTTEDILRNATDMSHETVRNLVQQADVLAAYCQGLQGLIGEYGSERRRNRVPSRNSVSQLLTMYAPMRYIEAM